MKSNRTRLTPDELARSRHRNLRQLLLRASRTVNRLIFDELTLDGHTEIKISYNAVLENLDHAGSTISVLAERAGMTKQSMSVIVRELEDMNYVAVSDDPADGRLRIVKFTKHGWQLMLRVFEVIDCIEKDLEQRHDITHLKHFREVLVDLGKFDAL